MTVPIDAFEASVAAAAPPPGLSAPLAAMWWTAKGDWARAHAIAQDDPGRDAAWVHAHLHRREGDAGNARYWYNRAGRAPANGPLDAEWAELAAALLAAAPSSAAGRSSAG